MASSASFRELRKPLIRFDNYLMQLLKKRMCKIMRFLLIHDYCHVTGMFEHQSGSMPLCAFLDIASNGRELRCLTGGLHQAHAPNMVFSLSRACLQIGSACAYRHTGDSHSHRLFGPLLPYNFPVSFQ